MHYSSVWLNKPINPDFVKLEENLSELKPENYLTQQQLNNVKFKYTFGYFL